MEQKEKSVFATLNAINCNEHTEKKNGLTYLSWSWAWGYVKKIYPEATYTIRNWDNKPYLYDEALGYMVETSVTIMGQTHIMWLTVMDGSNNAMKAVPYTYTVKNPNFKYAKQGQDGRYYDRYGNEQAEVLTKEVKAATMFDINTSIMRCLTKNLAMFGLGLYIYAGEDLPIELQAEPKAEPQAEAELIAKINASTSKDELRKIYEENPNLGKNGTFMGALTAKKKEIEAKKDETKTKKDETKAK